MTEPLEQAIHESSYDATCSTNDSRRIWTRAGTLW
jgi:hypothetical protein